MIIDPDFPDHWKVQMLSGLLNDDPAAAVYLIRLWGHCQNRKKDTFENLPPAGLCGICRYRGDALAFEAALTECGFIKRQDKTLKVNSADLVKWPAERVTRDLGVSSAEWEELRHQVFKRDGYECVYCGSTENIECDHFMPLILGGLSEPDNLVTACRTCNRSKGAKHPDAWLSKGVSQ